MKIEPKTVFDDELKKYNLKQCRACDKGNHERGFVRHEDRETVHLDSPISDRRSLFRGLHEIGHCINVEHGLRSWQAEAAATKYATETMRESGFTVPASVSRRWKAYTRRKKRHGDNVRAGRRRKKLLRALTLKQKRIPLENKSPEIPMVDDKEGGLK